MNSISAKSHFKIFCILSYTNGKGMDPIIVGNTYFPNYKIDNF